MFLPRGQEPAVLVDPPAQDDASAAWTYMLLAARGMHPHTEGGTAEPLAALVINVILAIVACSVLASCFTVRVVAIKDWPRVPYLMWLVLAIYVCTFFVLSSMALIQFAFNMGSNFEDCQAGTLICLVAYSSTKTLVFLFLIDRVHIVRGTLKRRTRSKLYIFNLFIFSLYLILFVLLIVYRINIQDDGTCVMGLQRPAIIPEVTFEIFINVYLTALFLWWLSKAHTVRTSGMLLAIHRTRSYASRNAKDERLRKLGIRTLIGTVITLTSTVANLTALLILEGEDSWLCFLCCRADMLITTLVIHCITSNDHAGSKPKGYYPDDTQTGSVDSTAATGSLHTAHNISVQEPSLTRPKSHYSTHTCERCLESGPQSSTAPHRELNRTLSRDWASLQSGQQDDM